MKQLLSGVYGTRIHLPLSGMALSWRRWSRRRRSKEDGGLQQVTLPTIPWRACTPHRYPRVWESDKANENIRVSELAVLRALAAHCDHETDLIEIGTFDGRTALNLAFSAPGERHMVEKDQSGARISAYRETHRPVANRIHRLYGDSGSFDFSPYYNSCSLVFVDGSHAYDYVHSDTDAAMKMVKPAAPSSGTTTVSGEGSHSLWKKSKPVIKQVSAIFRERAFSIGVARKPNDSGPRRHVQGFHAEQPEGRDHS